MNAIQDSISNLERMSKALEEYANKQENYNSPYATYLDNLAADMYRHASELKTIGEFYV